MKTSQERQQDQLAYRQMKGRLSELYAPGTFVAISGGQVVADADHMDALRALLQAQGRDPRQVLVVRAGEQYPENAVIFL